VIDGVDLAVKGASADVLEKGIDAERFDLVIYSAGYFTTDVSSLSLVSPDHI
jgi:hypothetical protein